MSYRPKRKRFYYAAGIISLILLPVVCISFLRKHGAFEQLGIINVLFWDPVTEESCMAFNPDAYYLSLDYKKFHLTGNNLQDSINLKAARQEVRKLIHSKDTLGGVRFHFDRHAQFWTFIKAIEICKTENVKTFMPHENDIWIFYPRPERISYEENLYLSPCAGIFYDDYVDLPPSEEQIEQLRIEKRNKQIRYYLGIIEEHYISVILLGLMAILTLRRTFKLKRNWLNK